MTKKILLDTNILVYAHDKEAPQQSKAQKIMFSALEEQNAAISWQSLLEFYNVVTDERKVSSPISPKQTEEIIEDYLGSEFVLIYPDASSYTYAIKLAAKLGLKGRQRIFDALLAVTMQQWKITTIYTNDVAHFKIFPNIHVINPFR
jgi:predicted nucleic acid-binding protein